MSFVAPEMKNVTGPQVVLILGLSTLCATIIIWLSILKLDPVAVISGLAPILLLVAGAFGWAKVNDLKKDVSEVRDLSNGRLTEQRDDNKLLQQDIKTLHERIAALSILLPSEEKQPDNK